MQQVILPNSRDEAYAESSNNAAPPFSPQGWEQHNVALGSTKLPPPDLVQILGKAQACCQGLIEPALARSAVEHHHAARARAAIRESSEEPLGVEIAARTRLAVVKKDLVRAETALTKVEKFVEEQVPQKSALTSAEKAQMAVLGVAGIFLAVFSVYGTMSFVAGSGILSGASAWGIALGPIAWAVVVKIALATIGNDSPKRLTIQVLAGVVAFCAVAWIATLAFEANSTRAQTDSILNLSSATVEPRTSGGWWLVLRAVTIMCIELAGAAIITDKFFDIWMRTGCTGGWTKNAVINPKFAAYDSDKAALLQQQSTLELVIGRIEAWHAANEIRIAEYISRASAIFDSNVATLLGAHHAA